MPFSAWTNQRNTLLGNLISTCYAHKKPLRLVMSLKNTSENFEKVWHVRTRKPLIFIEPTDIWGHTSFPYNRRLGTWNHQFFFGFLPTLEAQGRHGADEAE